MPASAPGSLPAVGKTVLFVRDRARPSARIAGTTMSGDALSDLLRAVRLRGAVFFYLKNADPWVAETPTSSKIIPAVMPGVEHLMPFHESRVARAGRRCLAR